MSVAVNLEGVEDVDIEEVNVLVGVAARAVDKFVGSVDDDVMCKEF